MQPPVTGSLVWQQSQQVQNNTTEHMLLFSADASKISNKSPNPDPSMNPKLAKEIFLKTWSSCIAFVPALGHSSRSVISSLFVLLYREAQERAQQRLRTTPLLSGFPWSAPTCGGGSCLPPAVTQIPSTRAFLHLNCGTLWHWTSAIFYLLKKITMWMAPAVWWFGLASTGSGIKIQTGLKTIIKAYAKHKYYMVKGIR